MTEAILCMGWDDPSIYPSPFTLQLVSKEQLGPIASEILQIEILIIINTSEGLACYFYSKYVKFIKINATHEKLRA